MLKCFTDVSRVCHDVPKCSVFVDINEEERCRFAVSLPDAVQEEYGQDDLEKRLNGSFVDIRFSLFMLTAKEADIVSQVMCHICLSRVEL